jgi:hypothetical protein
MFVRDGKAVAGREDGRRFKREAGAVWSLEDGGWKGGIASGWASVISKVC